MENAPKNIVSVDSSTIVRIILFLLLFAFLFLIRDTILIVLTAVVIASAIEPATKWLSRYNIPRVISVILIYLLTALLFISIVYFIIPVFLEQAYGFTTNLPKYVSSFDLSNSIHSIGIESDAVVKGITDLFAPEKLLEGFQQYFGQISGGALRAAGTIFGGFLDFILIIIISFYLSVQQNGISRFLRVITPYKHQRYVVDLWKRSQLKIGRWMQGQLLLGVIIGVLVYAGLSIIGVDNAFLFAILAGVFEIIPFFGPVLSAIPPMIVGFVDGGLTAGLLVVLLFIVIQQLENHLIYPLVVNKVVGVPPLLVILALIIGAQLAGILGLILSAPIAAAVMEFTNDIQKRNRELEEAET